MLSKHRPRSRAESHATAGGLVRRFVTRKWSVLKLPTKTCASLPHWIQHLYCMLTFPSTGREPEERSHSQWSEVRSFYPYCSCSQLSLMCTHPLYRNWKKIAESFLDRTEVQCLHRWQKVRSPFCNYLNLPCLQSQRLKEVFGASLSQVLNPELVKGPWTTEEDAKVIDLVNTHGAKKWSLIASCLPGRIGKQCRER